MSRIFLTLACISLLVLLGALWLGMRIGAYNETYQQYVQARQTLTTERSEPGQATQQTAAIERLYDQLLDYQQRARMHILTGIAAGLIAILVNCISVTYYIGTGRWCKEVVTTYDLDSSLLAESRSLKSRAFPWSVLGILTVLVIVMLGAASDPGTRRSTTAFWVTWHLYAAMFGTAVIALCYMMQFSAIAANTQLVERICQQVQRIRVARGMDPQPFVQEHA